MATVNLTAETFENTVKDSGTVLVDFWATWCGPCQQFGPVFEESSTKHEGVVHAKVDTDANQDLAAAFGITSIPTLMAFRDGVLVFSQPGALSGAQLEQVVKGVEELDMDEVRSQIAAQQQGAQGQQDAAPQA